ncbi:MAG: DUF192 domain-containing protein [Sphingobium sp.]
MIAVRGKAPIHLTAEIATSKAQQEAGLMFRKNIGDTDGMVFPMLPPRTVSFWMKDTLIPLDLIFVGTDGSIAMIAPQAKPRSLVPMSTGTPVSGVLELAGGRAAQLGLREGDHIAWGACAVTSNQPPSPLDPMNFCPSR